ncbi:hypothetical protein HPP92_025310 [Vanilla planifolia]|uniref:Uncharacterized protein n=1 Tax=Vanilla planifolia TaxID=51239 RepID=A0A835PKQ9_VANPL|nr:hypothetical protein HPP92_025310 [Vanilla planifolia]
MSASFGPSHTAATNKTAYYAGQVRPSQNELAMDCQKEHVKAVFKNPISKEELGATSLPPPFLLSSSPSVKWNVQVNQGYRRLSFF